MPRVQSDGQGRLVLPEAFLERRHLPLAGDYWLDEREGDLVLHSYSYLAIDGRPKQVQRYTLGKVQDQSLAEVWMSEEYTRFRSEVRAFHSPSCPDCDLRATCDLRERNEACWGWNPSCADCLWAQDIVRCP